uniref:Cc-nbs-lrr resistance protein n=1 Tax=Solanum tuberosum TaxID=4113 RepID=M1BPM8_SOLTU
MLLMILYRVDPYYSSIKGLALSSIYGVDTLMATAYYVLTPWEIHPRFEVRALYALDGRLLLVT